MVAYNNHIEDKEAYAAAIARNIARNAMKTTIKRVNSDPEFAKIFNTIETRADRGDRFFSSLCDQLHKRGKITEKQEAAVKAILAKEEQRRIEARAKDAGSMFIGELKKRSTFTLTLTGYKETDGQYGTSYFHAFKDIDGNVVIYKGTKPLVKVRGETITVVASVKAHIERDGVKQTIIQRPA